MGGIVSTNEGDGTALDEARSTVARGLRHADDVAKGLLGPAYAPVNAVAQLLNPMDGIEALKRGGRAMLEGRPVDAAIETVVGAAGLVPAEAVAAKLAQAARRAVPENTSILASKSARIYNPPTKPQRPFKADYPAGAKADDAGNLTHDIDGNPLEVGGRIVGRRVAGGADEALPAAEFDAIAKEGTGRVTETLPLPRNTVGRVAVHPVTGRPLGVALSNKLTPEDLPKVYGHEIGHVIDQLAGEIPTKGLSDELKAVYNTLNNPNRTRDGAEAATFGKPWTPAAGGHKGDDVPREWVAEAIRAYMADPNYLKTVAPKTAAAIRKAVYANPNSRTIIQFNSIGGTVASGLHGAGRTTDEE